LFTTESLTSSKGSSGNCKLLVKKCFLGRQIYILLFLDGFIESSSFLKFNREKRSLKTFGEADLKRPFLPDNKPGKNL